MSSVVFGPGCNIISVCLLAKNIAEILENAKNSAAEYRSLVNELRLLERSLLEIELVACKHGNDPVTASVFSEIPELIGSTRATLDSLHEELKKYGKHLGQGTSPRVMTKLGMGVRWGLSGKDNIANFRTRIAAHSNTINMMLMTANVSLAFKSLDFIESSTTTTASARHEQVDALNQIRQDLQGNFQLLTSMTDMVRTILHRFEWFKQLLVNVKGLVTRGLMVALATHKAVLSLQESLNHRIDRQLIQEPFVFEDAMGRVSPVHLQFITSWNAFDAVLVARFEGLLGLDKVQKKEFILQERSTKCEITREKPWEGSFRPGQSVYMSMMFECKSKAKNERNRCPHCWAETDKLCEVEVTCSNCGIIYQRITDAVDIEPKPIISEMPTTPSRPKAFTQSNLIHKPVAYGPKGMIRRGIDSWQDLSKQISSFKRVRILTKEERLEKPGALLPYFSYDDDSDEGYGDESYDENCDERTDILCWICYQSFAGSEALETHITDLHILQHQLTKKFTRRKALRRYKQTRHLRRGPSTDGESLDSDVLRSHEASYMLESWLSEHNSWPLLFLSQK